MTITSEILRRTPLHALHLELGGKIVPFAGYEMPVQYAAGILKEGLKSVVCFDRSMSSDPGETNDRPKQGPRISSEADEEAA